MKVTPITLHIFTVVISGNYQGNTKFSVVEQV